MVEERFISSFECTNLPLKSKISSSEALEDGNATIKLSFVGFGYTCKAFDAEAKGSIPAEEHSN